MKRRSPSFRPRGFTLIELLVVVAIVAILAAILFPVFARARAKAWQATCQSNLKQIAFAIKMYADDSDGYGPISPGTGCWSLVSDPTHKAPGGLCNAAIALKSYDAGWAIFVDRGGGTASPWTINPLWICPGGSRPSTYKMLFSRGGSWHMWKVDCPSIWAPSSSAALVGDCWGYEVMTATPDPGVSYGYWNHFILPKFPGTTAPSNFGSVATRAYWNTWTAHNGHNNLAFVDGHVKSMDADAMLNTDLWWGPAFQE